MGLKDARTKQDIMWLLKDEFYSILGLVLRILSFKPSAYFDNLSIVKNI